ncbi:hypothetical protein B0T14DRAFT_437876 [Immersiella caudata]|uniref:Uncharacterized protein n=1 Tax=Immersiella caudata TaxID=314043 RepID=A0AA40BU10_9PEZI|nr:hypothetical protein B0T14DRAFT_437876 [Immersiella caudata]
MASTFEPDTILRGTVEDEVLQEVYASDQDMYPAPLTFARLKSWVDGCPDLSISFRSSMSQPVGVIIALPIRQPYWDNLLKGTLKETDIDPEVAFPSRSENAATTEEVGLHVFHIERFAESGGVRKRGFAQFAVDEIVQRASLREGWKVVGLSALTATPAGKKTFHRLGFFPTGYVEVFIAKESDGADDKQEVRMVSAYLDDHQQLPAWLKGVVSHRIISQSEMTAKYL